VYLYLARERERERERGGGREKDWELLGTDCCTHVRVTYYQDYFAGGRE